MVAGTIAIRIRKAQCQRWLDRRRASPQFDQSPGDRRPHLLLVIETLSPSEAPLVRPALEVLVGAIDVRLEVSEGLVELVARARREGWTVARSSWCRWA